MATGSSNTKNNEDDQMGWMDLSDDSSPPLKWTTDWGEKRTGVSERAILRERALMYSDENAASKLFRIREQDRERSKRYYDKKKIRRLEEEAEFALHDQVHTSSSSDGTARPSFYSRSFPRQDCNKINYISLTSLFASGAMCINDPITLAAAKKLKAPYKRRFIKHLAEAGDVGAITEFETIKSDERKRAAKYSAGKRAKHNLQNSFDQDQPLIINKASLDMMEKLTVFDDESLFRDPIQHSPTDFQLVSENKIISITRWMSLRLIVPLFVRDLRDINIERSVRALDLYANGEYPLVYTDNYFHSTKNLGILLTNIYEDTFGLPNLKFWARNDAKISKSTTKISKTNEINHRMSLNDAALRGTTKTTVKFPNYHYEGSVTWKLIESLSNLFMGLSVSTIKYFFRETECSPQQSLFETRTTSIEESKK